MDTANMQTPDALREAVLHELKSTELDVQFPPKSLRADTMFRSRILRNERYVTRQFRAHNPDSLLCQRLLEIQREFVTYFVKHPKHFPLYQRLNRNDISTWMHSRLGSRMCRFHWPHLQSMRRVMLALWLNHFILTQRVHVDIAESVLSPTRKFQDALDADTESILKIAAVTPLASLPFDMDVKSHLRLRHNQGYARMSNATDNGVVFALHPAGGVFVGLHDQPWDLDLSLVNPDPETFPDPEGPIAAAGSKTGVHRLSYTDCKGREREVGYHRKSDDYISLEPGARIRIFAPRICQRANATSSRMTRNGAKNGKPH